MGSGDHAVIALHGSDNDRHYCFQPQGGQMGRRLANAGFRVIAVTWAGRPPGGFAEVAVAVAFAREAGVSKVPLVGRSRGGELAPSL